MEIEFKFTSEAERTEFLTAIAVTQRSVSSNPDDIEATFKANMTANIVQLYQRGKQLSERLQAQGKSLKDAFTQFDVLGFGAQRRAEGGGHGRALEVRKKRMEAKKQALEQKEK